MVYDMCAGFIERVDAGLVSCDVIHYNLQLGQFHLQDLRIPSNLEKYNYLKTFG